MNSGFPESDWRRFKEVHSRVLERFCDRILREVVDASQGTEESAQDRYLRVYKLWKQRDKQVASAFDDFRRSTAVMQLGIMRG